MLLKMSRQLCLNPGPDLTCCFNSVGLWPFLTFLDPSWILYFPGSFSSTHSSSSCSYPHREEKDGLKSFFIILHTAWRKESFYRPASALSLDLTLCWLLQLTWIEMRWERIRPWSQAGRTPLRADWKVLELTELNSWAPHGRDIPRRGNRKWKNTPPLGYGAGAALWLWSRMQEGSSCKGQWPRFFRHLQMVKNGSVIRNVCSNKQYKGVSFRVELMSLYVQKASCAIPHIFQSAGTDPCLKSFRKLLS